MNRAQTFNVSTMDLRFLDASTVVLDSGRNHRNPQHATRNTRLAYQTYGTLNFKRSNVILFMTPYGAHHTDIEWMIGEGRALDPTK